MTHEAGKGDKQRPTNKEAFDKHFEEIFGKKPPKVLSDAVEEQGKWTPKIDTHYDKDGKVTLRTIQQTPNGPVENL